MRRLWWLLLVIFAAFVPGGVYAIGGAQASSGPVPDCNAQFSADFAAFSATFSTQGTLSSSGPTCTFNAGANNFHCTGSFSASYWGTNEWQCTYRIQQTCPSHSAAGASGACTCDTGYKPGAGGKSCQPYSCAKGGRSFDAGYGPYNDSGSAMAPKLTCISPVGDTSGFGGCQTEFVADSAKCSGGKCWGVGKDIVNGAYCENAQPVYQAPPSGTVEKPADLGPDVNPPPIPCSKGTCPGTVNGAAVCVACDSTVTPPATTAASAPSGATAPQLPDGPPGAVSKDVSTSVDGSGKVTTTTNYYNAAGQKIGSTTGTGDQNSFCQSNPASPLCKSSSFGGSCAGAAGAFTCDGDAIQCQIAREQATRNCQMFAQTAITDKGVAAATGELRPADHPANTAADQAINLAGSLDSSSPLGAGSCPSDLTFQAMGKTLTVPLSKTCGSLQNMGYAVLAFAYLAALIIVFKQGNN